MEFTKEFFSESKIISEGTTSYILKHKSGIVSKLYKGAIDYIFKNGDYLLDEKDVWYESEVDACYRVIELSFDEIKKNQNSQR